MGTMQVHLQVMVSLDLKVRHFDLLLALVQASNILTYKPHTTFTISMVRGAFGFKVENVKFLRAMAKTFEDHAFTF